MKYVIASDLHGSYYYAKEIVNIFKKENAQKLILLGDIYNHGPRNVLPKDYSPMEVAQTLNAIKSDLIVIKGNCDSQVDTMISDFDFIEGMVIGEGERIFYLTHGHVYNKDNPPKTNFYCVIYGHFHTGFIKKENGVLWVNTGSLSLPKNGTVNSYLLFEDGKIYLKDLTGKIIDSAE
ncbi:MAG: phosphodiesterase [Clostridia bacterium]|nr:phosphodiesterase [Clostridia bacterium]